MSVAVRRNLLFFATGALVALAVVLLVREGDDAPAQRSGVAATTRTAAETAAPAPTRSVKLHGAHPRLRGHKGASATGGGAAATTTGQAGAAAPRPGGTSAAPVPHRSGAGGRATRTTPTPTVPADPAPADPAPDQGATGDAGQTTEPAAPADPATGGDDAATGGAGVTIPNPATPDASVGQP
jgi:hypothetical protein